MNNDLKTEKGQVPMVAIDGGRIRTLRETNKLTQLYVASVVGVTTDTISRWEKNKYPSIKRDNAEKLAVALEVELSEILKREEEPPPVPEEPEPAKKGFPLWAIALIVIIAIVGGGITFMSLNSSGPTPVTRSLPVYAAPGEIIPVKLVIARDDTTMEGMIIKERLPQGWHKVKADPEPAGGPAAGEELKWLIRPGEGPATISYTLQVPQSTSINSKNAIGGSVTLMNDGKSRTVSTGGTSTVTTSPYHWADRNGDNRIDDDEIMPAYYLTEEMKVLGLDWTTIENLWNAGGYRYVKGKGFVVK